MTDGKQIPKSSADGAQDFEKDPLSDKIGTSLRQLYDEVLGEDVPDDFLNLLRKADSQGSQPAGNRAQPKASK